MAKKVKYRSTHLSRARKEPHTEYYDTREQALVEVKKHIRMSLEKSIPLPVYIEIGVKFEYDDHNDKE